MFSFGKLDDLYYHSRPYIVSPEQATELTKDKGSYLQNPVNTESDEFDIQFRAAYIAKRQYDLGTVFGGIILFYWLVVAIVGVSLNFIAEKYPEILFKNSPTANYIRKSLVLPATFKENHGRPVKLFMNMYMTAPTRGQSLILLGYFLLNVILVCVKYDLYSDNPYVPSVQLQTSNIWVLELVLCLSHRFRLSFCLLPEITFSLSLPAGLMTLCRFIIAGLLAL